MSGLREVGFVGASVALTGALGYVIWTYMSSGERGPGPQQGPGVETRADPEVQKAAAAAAKVPWRCGVVDPSP